MGSSGLRLHFSTPLITNGIRLILLSLQSSHFLPPEAEFARLLRLIVTSVSPIILSYHSSDAFMAANDEQVIISTNPPFYGYLLENVREPPILRQLREAMAARRKVQIQKQVSPDQAQLLAMLVQISGAKRCIELGVFTGYSSLAVALVLPQDGRLIACEKDEKSLKVAKRYYKQAGVLDKVVVKCDFASKILEEMIKNESEKCSYDFAFVDVEMTRYSRYLDLLLQLVRVGGLIVFNKVLWQGEVVDASSKDVKVIAIRNFNKLLMEDKRVSISMVPIGNGMTICQKQ